MIDPQFLTTIGLFLLLILDLLVVAARRGLLGANLARLLSQREQMESQVRGALAVLNSPPQLQASLNLTQIILRFLLAGLALSISFPREGTAYPLLVGGGVLFVASVIVFLLEWTVGLRVANNPETWAMRMAPFARTLMFLLTPLLALPLRISRQGNGNHETSTVTEDELKTLVDAGQQEGVFEQGESKMIISIFRLRDTLAREIMIPRIDMLTLDVNTSLSDAVGMLIRSGHSRVPLYRETVDDVLGLLYAKDLLRVWREGGQMDSLSDLIRPAYFVPEAKKVDELLAEMQAQRIHMAIVVDEYGGVAGLVTLEDIVEEIVGEILDEYDQAEELPYQVISEDEYVFQGRFPLEDFNEIMGTSLPKDEADTLGGFIYSHIGRVPTGGERLQVADLELSVEQVSGRRIRKVRARKTELQRTSVVTAEHESPALSLSAP